MDIFIDAHNINLSYSSICGMKKIWVITSQCNSFMYGVRFPDTTQNGAFVYRLGRKIFILERGVRLSYALQNNFQGYSLIFAGRWNPIIRILIAQELNI